MKKRSILLMVILFIITLGIYGIYWYCSFQNQLKKKTGEGFGGGLHLLMTIITFGIYGLVWAYKVGGRLQKLGGANNGVMYLVLILFFGSISYLFMQYDANKLPETVA